MRGGISFGIKAVYDTCHIQVMMPSIIKRGLDWFTRYERRISPIAFLGGILLDNLFLTRIDVWVNNLALFSYLVVTFMCIVFVSVHEERETRSSIPSPALPFLHFIMQFAFGGLFSGYVVYYTRSASFIVSWPFMLILFVLLAGSEFSKKRYAELRFQLPVFFTALFSFAIFYLPVVLKRIGDGVFLMSGIISLVGIFFLVILLARVVPERIRAIWKVLVVSIGSIYVLINIFYFTNIIPPVPLSLKDIGVYHSVEFTSEGDYAVSYEQNQGFFSWLKRPDSDFHRAPNEPVYVYSSVFAPTDLSTKIFHRWEHYDDAKREWVITDQVSFPIYGGRDGGYRGYSLKVNILPGRWRVSVINSHGQMLGRVAFTVSEVPKQVPLQVKTM
jgi:hypothetical protein